MPLPLRGQITKRHLFLLVWLAEDRLDFSPYSSPSALPLPNWVLLGNIGFAQLWFDNMHKQDCEHLKQTLKKGVNILMQMTGEVSSVG